MGSTISTPKTLLTEAGKFMVKIPRDRDGSFELQMVPKQQRRMEGFDERILALRSRVTDAVLQDVEPRRQRMLDPC